MTATGARTAVGPAAARLQGVAADVRAGLTHPRQKTLPSRLLYDDVGSALFEVISLLPEYGLTRADERILRAHATEIVGLLGSRVRIAELGSGSGRKTRWILAEAAATQPVPYHPIDVSTAALASCRASLAHLHTVHVGAIAAEYLPGLAMVAARRRPGEQLVVLFLGSTIGNFEAAAAAAFLADIRKLLLPGDALLLGTDLLKPVSQLLAAYDDRLGVTAAFNRNLLARLNHELGADFDLSRFEHVARWNDVERNVEMHLVSRRAQRVRLRGLELEIQLLEGEGIWTESSHKFDRDEPVRLGRGAGFDGGGQWLDADWPFAETLLIAR